MQADYKGTYQLIETVIKNSIIIPSVAIVVFYLIKRFFDLKSRKQEINHSIYQQNRLTTISKFFDQFAKLDTIFKQVPFYQIMEGQYSSKELDEMLVNPINQISATATEIGIYFEPEVHVHFVTIANNFMKINSVLIRLRSNSLENPIDRHYQYLAQADPLLENNTRLLMEVYRQVQAKFN